MKLRGGYNMEDENKTSGDQKCQQVSFIIEHQLYEVDLNYPYTPSDILKKDVCALPSKYNENDKENLSKWMAFIEKWGNHFIIGVRLGGSIHGKALTKKRQNFEQKDICNHVMGEISARYHSLQSGVTANFDRKALCTSMQDDELVTSTSSLEWNGGDRSKFKLSMEHLSSQDLEEWEKSLKYTPAPLSSSLKLCPIYELVKQVDEKKVMRCKRQVKYKMI
ncbi:C7 [Mytilus edulis]|uniref:C7 n=1 Tax=Mytilus edulis TaxID=6550 RepID=A0A8S3Q7B1_MYTED|nr:C7 [Mytilus edulis]